MTTPMLAFHNDPAIKAKYLARIAAHAKADEIVQGVGFERNGAVRACAVGCTLDVYDPALYPIELGLPKWLALLEDAIHEGIPLAMAKKWPARFLRAINVGADVEPVLRRLTKLRMDRLLPPLIANSAPYARECEAAVRGVIALCEMHLADTVKARSAAESAAESAASAAESAWSATSAAESAWSAASARSVASARSAWSAAWQWEADALVKLLRACKAAA
ncbi:MAG: hypothetical protein ACREDH_05395 [Methylocella sp.]